MELGLEFEELIHVLISHAIVHVLLCVLRTCADLCAVVWDLNTLQAVKIWGQPGDANGPSDTVTSVAFSIDGKYVAAVLQPI